MRLALLWLALAGCVEAGLVPCGDLACPAGTQCGPNGGCVVPSQLTVCSGLDDGEPCTFDGTSGFCRNEVCEPLGCGNNVLSFEEVCDDGNTNNGDGCSADCRSNEICGNSIPDFAAGEECDDGNTVDGDDCKADCTLAHCGDGRVDEIEECDPAATLTTDRTCEDFGYYAGTLGCNSICRLDPVTCVGRCGDSIVQAEAEACDVAPPLETCLDYGFDLGALTCSSVCTPDPNRSCAKFGWKDLGSLANVGAPDAGVVGDVGIVVHFAYDRVEILEGGVWTSYTRPPSVVTADVRGDEVVFATGTTIERRANASSPFVALPQPPFVLGSQIVGVALADDGTLFARVPGSTGCVIHRFDGAAWTSVATTSGCADLVARSATSFAVQSTTTTVEWFADGMQRTITGAANVLAIRFAGGQLDVYRNAAGTITRERFEPIGPSVFETVVTGFSFARMAVADRAVFAFENGSFNFRANRGAGGRSDSFPGPPATSGVTSSIHVTRNGKIYGISNARLLELVQPAPSARAAPATAEQINDTVVATGDGALVLCGREVWLGAGATYTRLTTTAGTSNCNAAWMRSASDFYLNRTIAGVGSLVRYDGSSFTAEQLSGQPLNATSLTGNATTVLAVLADGTVARKTGSVWELLPAFPMFCAAQAAVLANELYVSGRCANTHGLLWRLDGGTWTELWRRPGGGFTSLHVAGGQLFAAAQDTIAVGTASSWTDYPFTGARIAGFADDVYAAVPDAGADGVYHWSADRWSPIRTPSEPRFSKLAVGPADVVLIGAVLPTPMVVVYGLVLPPR